jgi:ABC-type transport system involved in cytochrome c biogenesis permease subunit
MTATDSKMRYLPWVVIGVAVLYLFSAVGRSGLPSAPLDLRSAAELPVVDGGRVKPLDSVARVYLRLISQKETVTYEKEEIPAIQWFLDVASSVTDEEVKGKAANYQVFRIENEELLNKLGLKVREGFRYSYAELDRSIPKIQRWATDVERRKNQGKPIDLSDAKALELAERIDHFMKLASGRVPMMLPPDGDRPWDSPGDIREKASRQAMVNVVQQFKLDPNQLRQLPEDERALVIRAFQAEADRLFKERTAGRAAVPAWQALLAAYRAGDEEQFNTAVKDYRARFYGDVPEKDLSRSRVENYYNRLAPFYYCAVLYVMVALCCLFSWLGATEHWRRAAFGLLLLTLIIHATALVTRMYVLDRWFVFVTNLYSSAIFIGLGCVALGCILEAIFPLGVGNLVAAVLGVLTTIISHNMATGGDTLEMMQAVLDTNFWLATHVTTITLGYTATLVAGFIGVALIARILATVLIESFKSSGKPTTGHLFAFSFAVSGLVTIPLMLAVTGLKAAADFEKIPEFLFHIVSFLLVAAGVMYALALIVVRGANEGTDAHGNPVAGKVPPLARPLEPLALDHEAGKNIGQMIYGVICFATLLSFVGTVLGGIWADQSWGRFWGWDPKENGAILLVLWNALILHARWAGLVKDRGMAVLAVVGNIITSWSWFGTNQLGIGLHAYGFDNRLAVGCRWFWLSQLVIIGLGLVPQRYWASAVKRRFGPAAPAAPAAPVGEAAAPPAGGHPNGQANGHAPKAGKGKKAGRRR